MDFSTLLAINSDELDFISHNFPAVLPCDT
jgi:hypothetical protein